MYDTIPSHGLPNGRAFGVIGQLYYSDTGDTYIKSGSDTLNAGWSIYGGSGVVVPTPTPSPTATVTPTPVASVTPTPTVTPTITVTPAPVPLFNLSVNGGQPPGTVTSGSGNYPVGTSVAVSASFYSSSGNWQFNSWSDDTGFLVSGASVNPNTFVMPAGNKVITAIFTDLSFNLAVTSSEAILDTFVPAFTSGSGNYLSGTSVQISASFGGDISLLFQTWTGPGTVNLTSAASINPNNILMPSNNVNITASYYDPLFYAEKIQVDGYISNSLGSAMILIWAHNNPINCTPVITIESASMSEPVEIYVYDTGSIEVSSSYTLTSPGTYTLSPEGFSNLGTGFMSASWAGTTLNHVSMSLIKNSGPGYWTGIRVQSLVPSGSGLTMIISDAQVPGNYKYKVRDCTTPSQVTSSVFLTNGTDIVVDYIGSLPTPASDIVGFLGIGSIFYSQFLSSPVVSP